MQHTKVPARLMPTLFLSFTKKCRYIVLQGVLAIHVAYISTLYRTYNH